MERPAGTFDDRQLDVLLDRLDGIRSELQTLNRRLDSQESLLRIAGELSRLNESLRGARLRCARAAAAERQTPRNRLAGRADRCSSGRERPPLGVFARRSL